MADDPELRRLLWFILGGARGGENRAKIIVALNERPSNLNQLAETLGVDYRTVVHHISILQKNSLVVSEGAKYGVVFFLSPWLQNHYDIFEEICKKLSFKLVL